ncbi:MAG: MFS transporter [Planctomycetota bacterium]|nr:MAG: MFS transporter [Planctomycetota bacterium]REJ94314.1 MAG: MFS transporter [Planctomycetota bacterium]REK28991.1 MAG: MFS transporter [Planctomycetota bacterium]REK39575.1 MAG: MFS transporter [Planctomycetota bacterium]
MTETTETGSAATDAYRRDRSFWGMTATQFLGAFNDNVFKQLILLLCVDYKLHHELASDPYQSTAQALFALPFVLFSGVAGWLADRISKQTVVVWAKVAEIVVMLAGMAAFLSAEVYSDTLITLLFCVLCLMSLQSAFFGPSKYGILPELFAKHDLPAVNGMIQMTTFLAIIFGMAVCGAAKQWLTESGIGLWVLSAGCVGVAVIGTGTSLFVRRTPVAQPGLRLTPASFGVDKNTWRMLKADRVLRTVLLVSCLFWFLGGVLVPVVNDFGKSQMGYQDRMTSLLAALLGLGIAAGCILSAQISRASVRFGLVRKAAGGICVSLLGLSLLPWSGLSADGVAAGAGVLLVLLGVCSGVFVIPLQVFLQARPPAEEKGRMIGTMNLLNWTAMLFSAAVYKVCSSLFTLSPAVEEGAPRSVISWTFAVMAVLILPVGLLLRLEDEPLP